MQETVPVLSWAGKLIFYAQRWRLFTFQSDSIACFLHLARLNTSITTVNDQISTKHCIQTAKNNRKCVFFYQLLHEIYSGARWNKHDRLTSIHWSRRKNSRIQNASAKRRTCCESRSRLVWKFVFIRSANEYDWNECQIRDKGYTQHAINQAQQARSTATITLTDIRLLSPCYPRAIHTFLYHSVRAPLGLHVSHDSTFVSWRPLNV